MDTTIKNLMFDLAHGIDILDGERVVSKAEANDVLRKYCFETLGLTKDSSDKQIKRAFATPEGVKFFEVTEEIIEREIQYGWNDNEFFNSFVETRNVADGDRTDFWTDEEVILNVAKVSGDHHSYTIQRLGSGSSYTVPMSKYAVKVGGDIRLFLAGRKDWTELISAVAKAYTKKIQDELYSEFMNAASKLPVSAGFKGTGALSASKKDEFDEILSNVAMANDSAVVIMGTKTALKKLNALAGNGSVDWISASQKEAVAATGILGSYEGTTMLEIPQRFKDNKLAEKLVDSTKLLIFPVVDYKPVKFVDGGSTELELAKELGDTADDMQTYEAQRTMGVATVITRQFGEWDLDA